MVSLGKNALNQLFLEARSYNKFLNTPISQKQLLLALTLGNVERTRMRQ